MKKALILLLAIISSTTLVQAQSNKTQSSGGNANPFLFSVNTLTGNTPKWNLNYTGSYGQHASGPFGYDGLDQRFAAKGYLGNKFTLYANAAVGFANGGGIRSSQQAEILKDFIGGKKVFGPRLGFGVGMNRDWDGVGAIFSRITGSMDALNWRFGGNFLFEKAFSGSRDKLDFTTSVGFHHQLAGALFAGVEAVGQDLEGFWDEEEADGGAKLLIGPSLNYAPTNAKFGFSLCGGPVFYATKSTALPSNALRDLSTENGYTMRAMLTYNFNK